MFENSFGYDERVPEKIRILFMWLCQDVASLQSKWDFYLELYGKEQNTNLLDELAHWSFNIIEETLRNDMTMAICRLDDPPKSFGKENLSLAYLVDNCHEIIGLETLLYKFHNACAVVSKHRNKRVGHNDVNTLIKPKENPLPGINKEQIEMIVKIASDMLNRVFLFFSNGELNFHTIARGGADDLIFWLKAGKEHHSHL